MKLAISILLCLTFSGCSTQYIYNDTKYPTPEEALAAQSKEYEEQLAHIEPAAERIGGRALVVLPDRARYIDMIVALPMYKRTHESSLNYVAATNEALDLQLANILKKRNFFDQVDVQRVHSNVAPQSDADYVIWPYMGNPRRTEWYFLKKGAAERKVIPQGLGLKMNERLIFMANSIFALAKESRTH